MAVALAGQPVEPHGAKFRLIHYVTLEARNENILATTVHRARDEGLPSIPDRSFIQAKLMTAIGAPCSFKGMLSRRYHDMSVRHEAADRRGRYFSKRSVGATLAAMALGLARAGWHHGNGIAHLRRQFHRKTPYQPPPMGVITLPVPRQSGHTSPSSLPVPAQRRQMFSPDMGVPAGTSSGLDELGWVLDPVVRLDF